MLVNLIGIKFVLIIGTMGFARMSIVSSLLRSILTFWLEQRMPPAYTRITASARSGSCSSAPRSADLAQVSSGWYAARCLSPTILILTRKGQSEAAIALAYPEPYNQGKFLGFWLTFRVVGQLIGGAVNLGLNATNGEAGKVSYTVYIVFIALQCVAPLAGLLLTPPRKVERTDGRAVKLEIQGSNKKELIATAKLFCTREVRN